MFYQSNSSSIIRVLRNKTISRVSYSRLYFSLLKGFLALRRELRYSSFFNSKGTNATFSKRENSFIIHLFKITSVSGLPCWLRCKESACQCRRLRFDSWVGKTPWRREYLPTPVFLPGNSRGAWWATVHGVTKSRTPLGD